MIFVLSHPLMLDFRLPALTRTWCASIFLICWPTPSILLVRFLEKAPGVSIMHMVHLHLGPAINYFAPDPEVYHETLLKGRDGGMLQPIFVWIATNRICKPLKTYRVHGARTPCTLSKLLKIPPRVSRVKLMLLASRSGRCSQVMFESKLMEKI